MTGGEERTIPDGGRRRVVIEGISPQVDGGRFPVKRTVGDRIRVEAVAYTDGHDAIRVVIGHRPPATDAGSRARWSPLGNDIWEGGFSVDEIGRHDFVVTAWVDRFETWRRDFAKRVEAGQDVTVDLLIGAALVDDAAARAAIATDGARAATEHAERLRTLAADLPIRPAARSPGPRRPRRRARRPS